MFTWAYDDDAAAIVAVQWRGPWHEESFREALDFEAALFARVDAPIRLVIYVRDGAAAPGASHRRAIADISRKRPNGHCALVTRSPIHRGVLTAVAWLSPPLRNRQLACATFEEACDWMSRMTAKDSTVLRRLLAEAERTGLRSATG